MYAERCLQSLVCVSVCEMPALCASALMPQLANAAQDPAQANGGSPAPEASEAADKAPEEEQALVPASAGALEQPQPAKAAAAPAPPQVGLGLELSTGKAQHSQNVQIWLP